VSLMIRKSSLRWFGHVKRKHDNDWVKRCITWEAAGIRQRGRPKKTWWDCVKNDMESLDLSQKDAPSFYSMHISVLRFFYRLISTACEVINKSIADSDTTLHHTAVQETVG